VKALSIRQPWAELILRGEKTIEARPKRTNKRGERVYVYAGLQRIEPEEEARIAAEFGIDVDALPRGAILGTVEIIGCEPLKPEHSQDACFRITRTTGGFAWRLANPQRTRTNQKPTGHPQPSFFTPF
jgi:ASCH domain